MEKQHFFCTAASRANGESLYGTVAHIQSWLLVEHPGFWPPRAIEQSPNFSDRVKDYLRDGEGRSVFDRALLIRREHRRSEWLHAYFVRSCDVPATIEQVRFRDYEELPELPAHGESLDVVMYAVCTHGRHDKCCAKFGLPVYRTLRDLVGRRVWECSHVGGDRFAGNVVVFPHGLYYGHVTPEHVPNLVQSTERGEIWLKGYRGQSCFPRVVQIAEYFARLESGRLAIDEFRPVRVLRNIAGASRVDLQAQSDGSIHRVVYRTRTDALVEFVTCAALEPSAVPQYELVAYEVATI